MDKSGIPSVTAVALLLAPDERETPWQREAPTRHAIRRYLLIGCHWTRSWHRADAKAAALVSLARAERRVFLPRGWDRDDDLSAWLPTQECLCCGRFFVHRYENQQFCKHACALRFAEIEAWNIARAGQCGPPRCLFCHEMMEVDRPNQAYCNIRCKRNANIMEAAEQADADLGVRIKTARMVRGMTQAELAERAGIARSHIDMIERGAVPGSSNVREQILNILELDPDAPLQVLERRCGYCGVDISHMDPNATHCCNAHWKRAKRREGLGERLCLECGAPIEPTANTLRKYCSEHCAKTRQNRLELERRRKLNGNGYATNGSDPDDQPGPAGGPPGAPRDQVAAAAGEERASGADAAAAVG